MKFVTDCSADLVTKLRSIPPLGGKIIVVMSMEDLISQLTTVAKPAVGVLYEGARTAQDQGGRQIGVSAEIVFSILMLAETSVISSKVDMLTPAHDMLDQVRHAIHGTRAPTGHFWKWVMEAPAAQKNHLQVWVQRWSCAAQLPPSR